MRVFLFLIVILSTSNSFAQKKYPPPPPPVADSLSGPLVDTALFTKVEVEASVDRQQWIDHLTKNLQPYIEKAAKKGMKAGTYTVNVRFLVEKDGNISYAEALNDPGYGLAKAAVKVLKTGPKWAPGEQNKQKVRSYHTQSITFVIQEG
jgi:protein TonB